MAKSFDYLKAGRDAAEKYGFKFQGIFRPADQNITALLFRVPGPGICRISIAGFEELKMTHKELAEHIDAQAEALKDSAQIAQDAAKLQQPNGPFRIEIPKIEIPTLKLFN